MDAVHDTELATVESVDLKRYLGTWYEIARLPFRHEDPGARNVTAQYSLNEDGSIRVVNRNINEKGEAEEAVAEAHPVDATNSKLKVSFLPEGLRWIPFTKGDYWIIRLDPDYSTSLVGTPDRKYLWLLSRTPVMQEAKRNDWLEFARSKGFDVSKIILTPQTAEEFPSAK